MSRRQSLSPYLLTALLAGAGVTHFFKPGFYDAIVPPALPGPSRAWTYASGAVEIAVAAVVAHPSTRRRGALAAALLFVAVFPANVQMALDADSTADRAIAYARLPLQLPLVWWAWRLSRPATREPLSGRA